MPRLKIKVAIAVSIEQLVEQPSVILQSALLAADMAFKPLLLLLLPCHIV